MRRSAIFSLALFLSPLATAARFNASDGAFSLALGGGWTQTASKPQTVLSLQNGPVRVIIAALARPLDDAGVSSRMAWDLSYASAKRWAVYTARASLPLSNGSRLSYMDYGLNGVRWRTGYFSAGGKTYQLSASNLTRDNFNALAQGFKFPPAASSTTEIWDALPGTGLEFRRPDGFKLSQKFPKTMPDGRVIYSLEWGSNSSFLTIAQTASANQMQEKMAKLAKLGFGNRNFYERVNLKAAAKGFEKSINCANETFQPIQLSNGWTGTSLVLRCPSLSQPVFFVMFPVNGAEFLAIGAKLDSSIMLSALGSGRAAGSMGAEPSLDNGVTGAPSHINGPGPIGAGAPTVPATEAWDPLPGTGLEFRRPDGFQLSQEFPKTRPDGQATLSLAWIKPNTDSKVIVTPLSKAAFDPLQTEQVVSGMKTTLESELHVPCFYASMPKDSMLANEWSGTGAVYRCGDRSIAVLLAVVLIQTNVEPLIAEGFNVDAHDLANVIGSGRLATAGGAPTSSSLAGPPSAAPALGQNGGGGALAPLPKRRGAPPILWLLGLFLLASAGALAFRSLSEAPAPAMPREPAPPGTFFPMGAERRYLELPIVFEVQDASGQRYRASSSRVPSLIVWAGLALYLAGLVGALLHLAGIPVLLVLGAWGLLLIGSIGLIFQRKGVRIHNAEGELVLDARRNAVEFFSMMFTIDNADGSALARMKRSGFTLLRRHWQLLDLEGKVLLDIREDSILKALARKFFGHFWGLLRTNYAFRAADGQEVGRLTRRPSLLNRFDLDFKLPAEGPAALDPKIVMGAALLIETVDPNRWHPWRV